MKKNKIKILVRKVLVSEKELSDIFFKKKGIDIHKN